MKILLTIEEYKQRAIDLIKETAKQTIAETASDYFKFEILSMITKKCFTNEMMCVDIVNQLFFKVFLTDRKGKPITFETLKRIDEKEANEFNSQEWYVNYYEKKKKNYEPVYKIYPCTEPDECTESDFDNMEFQLIEVLLTPFDNNEEYRISLQVFKELYGYDYKIDREYKFSDCQTTNEL